MKKIRIKQLKELIDSYPDIFDIQIEAEDVFITRKENNDVFCFGVEQFGSDCITTECPSIHGDVIKQLPELVDVTHPVTSYLPRRIYDELADKFYKIKNIVAQEYELQISSLKSQIFNGDNIKARNYALKKQLQECFKHLTQEQRKEINLLGESEFKRYKEGIYVDFCEEQVQSSVISSM